MSKVVVLLSGGMDSSTLLYQAKADGHECLALCVSYGQRHKIEIEAARLVAQSAGVSFKFLDLSVMKEILSGSSQTSDDVAVPEGHYADETMKLTVVPNRNMILLSVALGYAISQKAEKVLYAAHNGDHAIYPDCRQEFVDKMKEAALLCDYSEISLEAPFCQISKADIAKHGDFLGVPFHLTYSCYNGKEKHCSRCGTCVERKEAFELAGVVDPTVYE